MISLATSLAAAAIAVAAALCSLAIGLLLRRDIRHVRESFESLLAAQRTEWTGEIDKLRAAQVEQLEAARPERRQAMQMFRSGISPDTAAAKLGVPKREMRLAAKVFGILTAG